MAASEFKPASPAVFVDAANVHVAEGHTFITFFGAVVEGLDAQPRRTPLFTAAIPNTTAPQLAQALSKALGAAERLRALDATVVQ